MNRDELRLVVIEELGSIAPESDPAVIDLKADIREAMDIDSMDFLNFVIALHDRLKIDIPERDYAQLRTIGGAVEYLAKAIG